MLGRSGAGTASSRKPLSRKRPHSPDGEISTNKCDSIGIATIAAKHSAATIVHIMLNDREQYSGPTAEISAVI